ncbi:MAG: class I SAM-dependent methyltransferase [Candidatus Binatia bacterium]
MIISQNAAADIASVAAHYDDLDLFYRTIWGTHVHHGYWLTGKESAEEAVENLTHLIARRAGIDAATCVCDIGCGYGGTAKIFAESYGARVIGITVSKKQYELAQLFVAGLANVNFMHCDGLANGLPAAAFDAVVSVESSEHMQDKPAFFAEVSRLLRPGGRFVVVAWLTRDQPGLRESKYLLEPICVEGRLPSMASASEYENMIAGAGFRNIEFEDLTHHVKKTWSVCALRCVTRISRSPFLRQRLFDPTFPNRVFAKTVLRIWLAYATGAMRYGLFTMVK